MALVAAPALAQEEPLQLTLRLRRDWGYGGFGEIQGRFTMGVSGPEDLRQVVFWLDDQVMGEVRQVPWQWKFQTDSFPSGLHTLYAVGYTQGHRELRSNEIRTKFLSAGDARRATVRVILVLLGGTAAVLALAAALTLLISRRTGGRSEPTTSRHYGLLGGAVCPKCGRPFALHWWGANIGLSTKLDRCPHCDQWSRVKRASAQELANAAAAEREHPAPGQQDAPTDEERLRRELDESRFVDL